MGFTPQQKEISERLYSEMDKGVKSIPILAIGLPTYYMRLQDYIAQQVRIEEELSYISAEMYPQVLDRLDQFYASYGVVNPCPEVRVQINEFLAKKSNQF
jgi:hypothetical protein